MGKPLGDAALDQIFRTARTRRGWTEEGTPEVLIRATYDLLRLPPTASNICPGRFLFVRTAEAKARLMPHLDEGNRKQTETAPWTGFHSTSGAVGVAAYSSWIGVPSKLLSRALQEISTRGSAVPDTRASVMAASG